MGSDNSSVDIVLENNMTISIDRYNRYIDSELVGTRQEMEANAKLISKAPEMLEMLKKIVHNLKNEECPMDEIEIEQLIYEATKI